VLEGAAEEGAELLVGAAELAPVLDPVAEFFLLAHPDSAASSSTATAPDDSQVRLIPHRLHRFYR